MATYYMSTGGSDGDAGSLAAPWSTLQHAIDTMVAGDTLYVRGGTYTQSGIAMKRSGTVSSYITVRNYTGETPIFSGASGTTRFINWATYAYIELIGLTIQAFNAEGVYCNSAAALGNKITNCTFRYFDYTASGWASSSSIVLNIRQGSWVVSGTTFLYCKYNLIAWNGAAGTADSCTFDYGIPEAMIFSPGNSGPVLINNCRFRYMAQPWGGSTHFDYIQFWGSGNHDFTISNNLFEAHCYKNSASDAGYNNAPIMGEGGIVNLRVFGNVSTMYSDVGAGDEMAYGLIDQKDGTNVDVFNNTIYGGKSYGIRLQDGVLSGSVFNNIVINAGTDVTYPAAVVAGNNWTTANGDPKFVNPAGKDLRLQSSSPCIDTGTNSPSGITLPSTDKDGNDRIYNGTIDRGCYEYGAGSTPTGTPTSSATYFVATDGSDSDSGTATDQAWATPAKAFSTAQAGDTVYYRGGTYNIGTSLTTPNAGDVGERIVHAKYPGETPIFNRTAAIDMIHITQPHITVSGIRCTNQIDNTNNYQCAVKADGLANYTLLDDIYITSPDDTMYGMMVSATSRLTGVTAKNITVSAMGRYLCANWNCGLKFRYVDDSYIDNCEFANIFGMNLIIEQSNRIDVRNIWGHGNSGISATTHNCFGFEVDSTTDSTFTNVSIFRPSSQGNLVQPALIDDDNAQNESLRFYNCQFWTNANIEAVGLRRAVSCKFYNSVFASPTYGINSITGGSGCVVKNSVFYGCSTSGSIFSGDHNRFVNVSIPAWSTSSTTGDPGMAGPSTAATTQAAWDLEVGSTLIDAGTTPAVDTYVPTTDRRGYERDANTDIGPYEYGADTPPTATTAVPGTPSGLAATTVGTNVYLTWTGGGGTVTAYKVHSSFASDKPYAIVGTTATTAFAHLNLPFGSARYYKVSAANEYGESDYSNIIQVTVGATGRYEENDANISYHGSGSTTAATIQYITPVDITPTTAGAWEDKDLTSYIGANATGIIVKAWNGSTAVEDIGMRCPGSTAGVYDFSDKRHVMLMSGVSGRHIELYRENAAMSFWLVGYLNGPEAVFLINPVDKTIAATGGTTFEDVSISANVTAGAATAAILELDNGAAYDTLALRMNGSADSRPFDIFRYGGMAIVGLDATQTYECARETATITQKLVGYLTTAATVVMPSAATDYSMTTVTAWTDMTALPANANGGFFECKHAGTNYYDIRKNGYTGDANPPTSAISGLRHAWLAVECDGSQLVEGIISSTSPDMYLIGHSYISAGGGSSWYAATSTHYSAVSAENTNVAGDYAEIAFTGTRFSILGTKGPSHGYAQILIDGVAITDGTVQLAGDEGTDKSGVDLYSSAWAWQQTIYSATGLASEAHTATYKCVGAHNPSGTDNYIQLDFFEYLASSGDTTPPDRPTNMLASSSSIGDPLITWTAVTSADADGYYIYKGTSPTGTFELIAATAGSATTAYADADNDIMHAAVYYKVTTYDTSGNESAFGISSSTTSVTASIVEDNVIASAAANTAINAGITNYVGAGSASSNIYRSLLKPQLPTLATGSDISIATLNLYILSRAATGSLTPSVHRMLRYWAEGSKNWAASTQGDSNWGYAIYTTDTWATAGAYNATDCASTGCTATAITGSTVNVFKSIDITNIIDEIYNGSIDYGLLFKDVAETVDNYTTFASVQNTTTTARPYVDITYYPSYVSIIVPDIPLNLYASLGADRISVDLSWEATTATIAGYIVERATASTGTFSLIATRSADEHTYTDTVVTAGDTYYYRIASYTSDSVTSQYSNIASVKVAMSDFEDSMTRSDQDGWGNGWVFVGDGVTGAIQNNEAHLQRYSTTDSRIFVFQSDQDYAYQDVEVKFKWKNYGTTGNRDIRAIARYSGATALANATCFAGGYQKTTTDGTTGGSLYLQSYVNSNATNIATAASTNIDDINHWYYGKLKCQQYSTTATLLSFVMWRDDETEPNSYTGTNAITAYGTTAHSTALQNVAGSCGFTSYFRSQHIHYDNVIFDNLVGKYYVTMTVTAHATASMPTSGAKSYSVLMPVTATNACTIIGTNSPDAPTNLVATVTEGQYYVDLAWAAPTSGYAYDGYNIYRKATTGSTYSKVGSCASAVLDLRDYSATNTDYSYDYVVRTTKTLLVWVWIDGVPRQQLQTVESGNSNTDTVVTNPDPPNLLSITASITANVLAWDASTDTISGYQIYRSENNGIDWSNYATTTATSYTDIHVIAGKAYWYRIRTYDDLGAG